MLLTSCSLNSLSGSEPTTTVLAPTECAQGLFSPIFPTDEDWDIMSRELYWQIQDHNTVFDN